MDFVKFQELLDEQINWPDAYQFKFITKTDAKDQVLGYLAGHKVSEKISKNGKYTSVSINVRMKSPDAVISKYKEVAEKVEGVISL